MEQQRRVRAAAWRSDAGDLSAVNAAVQARDANRVEQCRVIEQELAKLTDCGNHGPRGGLAKGS
eukprot:2581943-Rhodomonas_salina.5